MIDIKNYIEEKNTSGKKILSIFLTSGYPDKNSFVDLAVKVIDAGADILEIGVPFGDSLADGPVVQASFTEALKHDITLSKTLEYIKQIKAQREIPLIIMSSANPIQKFGLEKFAETALEAGVDGLTIPDIPPEEYDSFFDGNLSPFQKTFLTTPTSSEERIKMIDELSSGFVYCVSVVGITGERDKFSDEVLANLERTYSIITKNKMLIGFGISSGKVVETIKPFCDGVIVGSGVVKRLKNDDKDYSQTLSFIKELSEACRINP